MYNKRTWLNKHDSASTGSVVAFDGDVTWGTEKGRTTFLHISDCRDIVRLHKSDDDSITDFINKMELLKDEIGLFIDYLKTTL